jgi:hypothetical protein
VFDRWAIMIDPAAHLVLLAMGRPFSYAASNRAGVDRATGSGVPLKLPCDRTRPGGIAGRPPAQVVYGIGWGLPGLDPGSPHHVVTIRSAVGGPAVRPHRLPVTFIVAASAGMAYGESVPMLSPLV